MVRTNVVKRTESYLCYINGVVSSGIPYGNAFHSFTRVCLTQKDGKTRMQVFIKIEFQRDCPWVVRASIEQGSKIKIKDFYFNVNRALRKVLTEVDPLKLDRLASRYETSSDSYPSLNRTSINRDSKALPHLPSLTRRVLSTIPSPILDKDRYLVVLVWILISFGLLATIQLKLQLDFMLSKLS